MPALGSVYDVTPDDHKDTTAPLARFANPFATEENNLLMPKLLSQRHAAPSPIRLVVSGDIHNMLRTDGLEGKKLPKLPKKAADLDTARVVFNVAVDTSNGKICWYEAVEKSSVIPLDVLAENLLATMQFAPTKSNIIAKGTVEIHYNLDEYAMIEILPSTAAVLYLGATLFTVLGIWFYSHYSAKEKNGFL